jgi:hypothetical protein
MIKKAKSDFKAVKNFLYPERPKNYKPPTFKEYVKKEFSKLPTKKETKDATKQIIPAMKSTLKNPFYQQKAKDFAVDAALTVLPIGRIGKTAYKSVKSVSKMMKRGK